MVKKYSLGLGLVLLVIGVLNFFVPGLETSVFHAILHIVAGVVGIALSIRTNGFQYIKWLSIVTILLAALGFAEVTNVGGLLTFPVLLKWVYLVIGLLSIWLFLSFKQILRSQN